PATTVTGRILSARGLDPAVGALRAADAAMAGARRPAGHGGLRAPSRKRLVCATEHPLRPLGVGVAPHPDEPPLPFSDEAFDLVTRRHPLTVWWEEIARVLRPGGTYLAQHVGHSSVFELVE
ncbi:hypothetical protein UK12_33690, partial [Saccharothrix sp. ST-888]